MNTDGKLSSGPVSIIAVRLDGRRTLFGHAADRESAQATIEGLRRLGLGAEIVEGLDPTTPPGSAIPHASNRRRTTRRAA